jgi:uncharacterized membrane protein YqiK
MNDLTVIEKQSNDVVIQARTYQINNQITYSMTADFLLGIKKLKKEIDNAFDESIKKAFETHRSLTAKKKEYYFPLEEAERIVKTKIKAYEAEMERIRLEAEAKAREEAKKKEAEEKAKLFEQAEEAMKENDLDKANKIIEKVDNVQVLPEIQAPVIEKIKGLGIRDNWKFRVVDEKLVPREYLCVDEIKIGKVVRALKKDCKIEGIEIYAE